MSESPTVEMSRASALAEESRAALEAIAATKKMTSVEEAELQSAVQFAAGRQAEIIACAERDRLDALAGHDDYRLKAWANRSDRSVANWGFMPLARPGARANLIRAVWNACESIETLRFLDLTGCHLKVQEMELVV